VDLKLNSQVTTISREGTQWKVQVKDGPAGGESFDYVVLACPLELTQIEFKNTDIPPESLKKRAYVTTHVTLVNGGKINSSYFGLEEGEIPEELGTVANDSIPFRSIAIKAVTDSLPIFKLFSDSLLDDKTLDLLFLQRKETVRHMWEGAYPRLEPTKVRPPFVLSDKLYYLNAMESFFSTMESQSLSGQNIANLLASSFYHK